MKHSLLKALFIVYMLVNVNYIYAQQIDLTVKFNPPACTYEVYATPDFTQNNFFIAGGSQISVLLPNTLGNSVLAITNVAGGPWTDNSQVYAPAAMPANDFHAISTNGSLINFTAGQEILLFTFVLPGGTCCAEGIRLFNNGSDPQSDAAGMAGGDLIITWLMLLCWPTIMTPIIITPVQFATPTS
jgi:hypothetical protein